MKDDLANEDLAHLLALTEPKDDMLKRETPLPKASPVCPVCGIAVPHAHDYAGLMTLIVKQKNDLAAAQAVLPCGHHHSLMLKSAETGKPLYCELCDCISKKNDAEMMESEAAARHRETLTALADTGKKLAAAQAERDDANKECGYRIGERDEARAEAAVLRALLIRYRNAQ